MLAASFPQTFDPAMKPLSLTFALLFPLTALADHEVGFIERFALAADREKALAELVPGSQDYYFFHALHYQNTRNTARLNEILNQWRERMPGENGRRRIIENREAIISYEKDPQATLKYLIERLGVRHDHQRQVRDQKPDLPTVLDQAKVARAVFLQDALNNDRALGSLNQDALAALVRDEVSLSPDQRRAVLQRLQRPDVPHLVEAVIADMRSQRATNFGDLAVHRLLLPEQLDELLKTFPEWAGQEAFVNLRLRQMAPGADVNVEYDDAERAAWLERVWAYAQKLPQSMNTVKARILYLRLDHDRKKGTYDKARFVEYLKLPRDVTYLEPRFVERHRNQNWSNLNADLSEPLLFAPPLGTDEALVRDYFLHLFAAEARADTDPQQLLAPWTEYVRDTWLRPILAEALIVNGIGNPERWASLITPGAFQQLKERVDIEFPSTNSQFFQPGADIQFDVTVKNTPQLIVKIFELNTLNFFQTQGRQLNTDLNLDGLVANAEQDHRFEGGPFKRTRQTFTFPDLKGRRGAWIIEFIGGGRSSRALVRVGQWKAVQQTGPSGDLLLVLDEKNQPVKEAVAWFEGRKLTRNEKLDRIVVPFTSQPGTRPLIIGDAAGTFATLTQFQHHQEDYQLDVQFHVEREQLLARREATLALRVALMLAETHLAPELITEPRLTLTTTTHDGVSTTREMKDLKLSAGGVLTQQITVPDRVAQVTAVFSGKVEAHSLGGVKRDVSASHSWEINGIDKTDAVNDGHLSTFDGQRVFELLGKNGEPVADQQVIFTFRHRGFGRVQTVPLRTDERGRVALGALLGIETVMSRLPNGRTGVWPLEESEQTTSSVLHIKEGETVRVPRLGGADLQNHSLLATTSGTFVADHSKQVDIAAPEEPAFLLIKGLAAGDYSLHLPGRPDVAIKVTAGDAVGGWVIGRHRQMELKGNAPLTIANVTSDAEFITVKLAGSSAFARVHVAASRFDPGTGIFGGLGGFVRFGAGSGTPDRLPNLYSAGREIGDEYRYILERRQTARFPGNMLTRPGLLLNPWETRSTELEELRQQGGEQATTTAGGMAGGSGVSPREAAKKKTAPGPKGGTNLDFLAASAPVIYNLIPDKDGVVRINRKALGDRQHVQVYAEDLEHAAWSTLTLPEAGTKFADQRLARHLDPAKPFTQKKEITFLESGKTLTLADILTSEMESYDTLGGVHSLFTTLSGEAKLALFAFILEWPKLDDATKRARYGEHACHELNFFLYRKDKDFFDTVIKPYLAHKKDKTFMDEFLLGQDLKKHLEPWAYARLNIVERILLAQRVEDEGGSAARHVRELWETMPPNPQEADRLFETALRGRALEAGGMDDFANARGRLEARSDGVKSEAMGALALSPAPPPPPAPAAAPAMPGSPMPAMTADPFSAAPKNADGAASLRALPAEMAAAHQRAKMLASVDEQWETKVPAAQLAEREIQLRKSGSGAWALTGANTYSGNAVISGGTLAYFGKDAAADAYGDVRILYRALGPTKEWAENNYHQRRIAEQDASLVVVNAFWRDYAAWVAAGARGGFVSANLAEAGTGGFTGMMLALAVLDLPFDAPKHTTKAEGAQFTFTAGGPCVIFHKEIKPAAVEADAQGQLLVSQSFFRQGDRYREEGNEKFEKYVTDEFLTGVTYGASIVVTNPTSSPVKAVVLMQIPQGSLPVLGARATNSRQIRLEPYTTQAFEYHFYFPLVPAREGVKFAHFPVNVATATGAAGAKPFEFNVVSKLTQVDKASWDYVSQYGTDAEVFAFLEQNNLERLDLEEIAWRCRQSVDFYRKIIAFLNRHHFRSDALFSYALLHNDAATLRELLKFRDDFAGQCGPFLASQLITLDPVERRDYEHLEYSPLVNQRAHRVGNEWRVANPAVLQQYQQLLSILAHKPGLDAMDSMSVAYHLFLQDRVEEALARFKGIDPAQLPARLQHDYFQCYAAFYEGDTAAARTLAAKYADHPVPRWKKLFAEVAAQLNEIDGAAAKREKGDEPDREQEQGGLADTEPGFDFKVEKQTISLAWKNLGEVTLNYYLMDPEFSFSSNPFVGQDAGRFSIIKPSKTAVQALPKDKTQLDVPLPAEYAKANVLVEVIGAGQRKTQAHHANTLKLNLTENYGRLEARDSTTDKPLPKAYVKVYARLNNGTVRFFKDGYTDLRGRFDYASLNAPENGAPPQPIPYEAAPANGLDYQMLKPAELNNVSKLSLLILSDTHGATVKEVDPPSR